LDITQRKLLEQQILRSQRIESIGTLAGGIAHDLNNALAPIVMSIDLLKLRFPDPASGGLLEMIDASAQRGADMVRQLLSFARGVEGRRMEVQMKDLVKDIEKIANDTFLKNIEVSTVLARDLWSVLGDSTQLHQVLLNLAVNARDAMPQGGTLTISAENRVIDPQKEGMNREMEGGPYVFIRMTDTGTGMPHEVIEKIFDPFFTTKEVGKGTGLGLSTTLGIVRSHGGHLRVSSKPGQGSTFEVFLPARAQSSASPPADIEFELPRGGGEWILVIDDEATLLRITQQTLETFGYRVLLARDGKEAVTVCLERGEGIAAVITDMAMPNMDGEATIQVLQRLQPELPIIVTSGLATDAQIASAANLGVKDFLSKPYTIETLLRTLRKVLSSGRRKL
jgi:nitrogen-specific signal transduction histidine kinase/CheY-like chemotaxis protein